MILFPYAGSSGKVAPLIAEIIQVEGYKRYAEPMVGSGAVFFKLAPIASVLGDSEWLHINLYRHVQDNPDILANRVKVIPPTREEFESRLTTVEYRMPLSAAADWYYLLWLCYNGVVKRKDGEVYMTFGDRYKTWEERLPRRIYSIAWASVLLKDSFLHQGDYADCPPGDIAFFDPPWFGSAEDYGVDFAHERLAEHLFEYEYKWLMTINHCEEAEKIYYPLAEWAMDLSPYYSVAPSAAGRGGREEKLIANFRPRLFNG